jgi:hypothetical protein
MKIGIIIIIVSMIWYLAHAIIYNYFLQKYNPEIFDKEPERKRDKGKNHDVQIIIKTEETPAWVMLLGMPPIPLFVLGVLIVIISFIVSLFN